MKLTCLFILAFATSAVVATEDPAAADRAARRNTSVRHRRAQDSNDGGADECFSGDTLVQTPTGHMAMRDLKLGDLVLTSGNDTFSPVYSFHHRDPLKANAEFLKITVQGDGGDVEITRKHFVHTESSVLRAEQVQVGDVLRGGAVVQEISIVHKQGVYAPVTMDGTIVVGGVVASVYASFLETTLGAALEDSFYHAVYTPHRVYCTVWAECTTETYDAEGFNWFLANVASPVRKVYDMLPGASAVVPLAVLYSMTPSSSK